MLSIVDDVIDALLRCAAADLALQICVNVSSCLQAYLRACTLPRS